ncbi:DTW domain-containing protein [Hydrogenophaga crassostreae]|uniref:tRNA-uridine aminocarboxypropyltransferase n=1 Tax=Hydrogenophaga crassostreae TaxID=1763535 RepID=A0A167ITM6_9BURK|nr:tRNA-uridine aminocarboxypropyltransferase [Hydrogenophaga crassostreae]AOW14401.1 DTW domain-containing protein [Hydrogenophaga crassostreae]OAD43574.1 DTW domain-containing protein [Hydrogenophaga crassostreae]
MNAVSTPHAVARLRTTRLAASAKPFLARGSGAGRCEACRLVATHCICAQRPTINVNAGVCLIMGDIEALKPSNTGWLVADVVADTFAFGWSRTAVDPGLLAVLNDPQWQPFVVFPSEYAEPSRVVSEVVESPQATQGPGKRPLFVLLDGTWAEARKMFRKSPYLDALPVLSLHPDHPSSYQLRRSSRDDHFCTSEVAALCLALAGETRAAQVLAAYLDVFTEHYLSAKRCYPLVLEGEPQLRLRALGAAMPAV